MQLDKKECALLVIGKVGKQDLLVETLVSVVAYFAPGYGSRHFWNESLRKIL